MDDLPKQKNFYDVKRQFQGRDQPTDAHPAPRAEPPPMGQLLFGVVFIAFIGLLFWLNVKGAREEHDQKPPPVATSHEPAAPAKH